MPSYFRFTLLALAYANDVLSFPGHHIPIKTPSPVLAVPTVTPHPAGGFKKRQNPGDIVATYGTGSVLSKMNPAQLANATIGPNQYCTPYANPDEGHQESCRCNGADPTALPVNDVSSMVCAYTVVPGSFSPSTTEAPTSTGPINTPCTRTDVSGVVWAYESEVVEQAPGYQISVTDCAGPSSAVSTVASIAAQASDAAYFENGLCAWASDTKILVHFGVLIPNWQSTFDFDTANNDFRGSLDGSSRCNSFSHYSSAFGGPNNNTFGAKFWADDFCTAYEMTQIIKATTGNAYNIPCKEYHLDVDVHPDEPEVPPGESVPEEPPLEIEPEKRAALEWLQRL